MEKNKDYIKGMKYLLKESKKANLDIRRYPWVISFSYLLSKYKACYCFWRNTVIQDCLDKVKLCFYFRDIFFGSKSCLFIWSQTSEGDDYWRAIKEDLETELDVRKFAEIRLYDVFGGNSGKWIETEFDNDNFR